MYQLCCALLHAFHWDLHSSDPIYGIPQGAVCAPTTIAEKSSRHGSHACDAAVLILDGGRFCVVFLDCLPSDSATVAHAVDTRVLQEYADTKKNEMNKSHGVSHVTYCIPHQEQFVHVSGTAWALALLHVCPLSLHVARREMLSSIEGFLYLQQHAHVTEELYPLVRSELMPSTYARQRKTLFVITETRQNRSLPHDVLMCNLNTSKQTTLK